MASDVIKDMRLKQFGPFVSKHLVESYVMLLNANDIEHNRNLFTKLLIEGNCSIKKCDALNYWLRLVGAVGSCWRGLHCVSDATISLIKTIATIDSNN